MVKSISDKEDNITSETMRTRGVAAAICAARGSVEEVGFLLDEQHGERLSVLRLSISSSFFAISSYHRESFIG